MSRLVPQVCMLHPWIKTEVPMGKSIGVPTRPLSFAQTLVDKGKRLGDESLQCKTSSENNKSKAQGEGLMAISI